MQLSFLGASGTVTGSAYLLETADRHTALVDFGMFQEEGKTDINFQPLSFDAKKLDAVFVTHAHLDHCGRLPLLIKQGFTGSIFLTEATKAIAEIALLDAAHIAMEDTTHPPLYTPEDVEKTLQQMQIVAYDRQISVGDFLATFRNAGHILGSASITIAEKDHPEKTIIFSGDLGNTPEDLIQPTEPMREGQIVVMESTYGDRIHLHQDPSAILQKEIATIAANHGILLIPAFSIERTQEILHRLYHLQKLDKIVTTIPTFLDSPMAIRVTEVFEKYRKLYNDETKHDDHPFTFPDLTLTPTSEESKAIIKTPAPKIIIAGSGMMSGGRILHHLVNYASLPTTQILFTGYQANGTLGRTVLDGVKQVMINKQPVEINAGITAIESLSSHADQPKLLQWLKQIKGIKQVFLTHGENEARQILAAQIQQTLKIESIILPEQNTSYQCIT